MAVEHLVNLGHKRIAFLNGSLYSLVADQRQEAFENAIKEYNEKVWNLDKVEL